MAQELANHDSMPRSAIALGVVDYVLRAEEMPDRLRDFVKHERRAAGEHARALLDGAADLTDDLRRICALVRRQTEHDFSGYKQATILRRVQRRMQVRQAASMREYLDMLRDPTEADLLFRSLLIGVTRFFRDAEAFDALAHEILPLLINHKGGDQELRIWVAGCSSGEEAYSIAIVVREAIAKTDFGLKVKIFATDIDDAALDTARSGRYPEQIADSISAARLARFFVKQLTGYQVCKEIRELCIFSNHNLIADPPFSHLDLLCCRNVLIYFESDVQKIIFTGAVHTGKRVAAACGARLIPCVMELGGKAPLIACADADLERTARAIVFGGFSNSGQACISVERVYAHKDIYGPLVARVRTLVSELKQGDPSKDYVDVGAIIFPKQIEVAEAHIDDALKKGAELVAGGHRKQGPGQFFEPTVLARCSAEMTVMNEEIFGPIVPIQKVDSEEEAITLSNASHLGLNGYVFTKDREKGIRIAERVQAGSVVVNDVLINYAAIDTPFGGIKNSGFGRVHGDDALRDMASIRHVNYDRFAPPSRDPLWFPYSAKSFHWMMRGVRALFSGSGIVQRLSRL